jgi:uncharacterized membrane protein
MAIWRVSRFQLPIVDHPSFGDSGLLIFGDHFNPSMLLLAPLYWITSRQEIILIAQTLASTFGAFFAFLIARKCVTNKLAVFSLIFAYLGFVGLQNALITDLHDATLSVLPITIIFWALINRKWKTMYLFLIVLLGLKESFSGLGVAIGIYIILRDRKNYLHGVAVIAVSIIWGLLAIHYIIPHFSKGIYLYTPGNIPTNPLELIKGFTEPPIRIRTMFYSFLTFGFTPFLDIAILPAIFENFFERFILLNRANDLGFHYNAPLSPLMFMGGVYAFKLISKYKNLKKIVPIYAIFIVLIVGYLQRVQLDGPLGLSYNRVFYQQNDHVKYVDEFVKHFPKSGVIMTQNDLAVRLTHQNVKLIRLNYGTINPDYVILNLTDGMNANSYYPVSAEEVKSMRDKLIDDKNYKLTKYGDELYIFSKI